MGPNSYKLRHTAWNWDVNGNLTATFAMIVKVVVNARGNAYTGNYVANSYDLARNVIKAMHAEGTVKGTRIIVD